jgi:hypothetical protein
LSKNMAPSVLGLGMILGGPMLSTPVFAQTQGVGDDHYPPQCLQDLGTSTGNHQICSSIYAGNDDPEARGQWLGDFNEYWRNFGQISDPSFSPHIWNSWGNCEYASFWIDGATYVELSYCGSFARMEPPSWFLSGGGCYGGGSAGTGGCYPLSS